MFHIQFPVDSIDLHNLGLIKANVLSMGVSLIFLCPKFVEKIASIALACNCFEKTLKEFTAAFVHILSLHRELLSFSWDLLRKQFCQTHLSFSQSPLAFLQHKLIRDRAKYADDHVIRFPVNHVMLWLDDGIGPSSSMMIRDPKMGKFHHILLLLHRFLFLLFLHLLLLDEGLLVPLLLL